MSEAVTVRAPAKLNLYLHVTGRRPDGYHTLESLIAFVGLADTVTAAAAPAGDFSLTVGGPFAGVLSGVAAGDNLVLRAARALARAAGVEAGAALHLDKHIPVAAGLGGGSADAAAALLALSALWGVPSDLPLADLALALGADVPVCLAARPSFVSGIGEGLRPVAPLPDAGVLLVNPRVAVETAATFAAFDAAGAPSLPPGAPVGPFASAAALAQALAGCANDLTAAARGGAPVIAAVLDAIAGLPGCRLARMAGSGATCFGLFDDAVAAARAGQRLSATQTGWWTWAGSFASRAEN